MIKPLRVLLLFAALLALAVLYSAVQTTRTDAAAPALPTATYTVNSTDDVTDGFCNATHCSFREAINISNNTPGTDTIVFDFNGPAVILPTSELPIITDPVIIDAVAFSTANCASASLDSNLHVTLSGFNAGLGASGLQLGAGSSGSTIKGLSIVLFDEYGIVIGASSSNSIIRCNHIGLDASGLVGLGNELAGIFIQGDDSTVGGNSISDRNVISGNTEQGILINPNSYYATIAGNYIGTKADGVGALGNGHEGVTIWGNGVTVGGFTDHERNVIADNGLDGILISSNNWEASEIINNNIGVDKNGDSLGNSSNGIFLKDGNGTTVGNSSAPNLIAHNGENGIRIGEDSAQNALRVNEIRGNNLLGIDLEGLAEASGDVTYNDSLDSDTGANDLQNFPVLSSAEVTGRVQGTLAGPPGDEISLFFYTNNSCDDSGHGEGRTFREAVDVTIPGGGVLFLDVTLNNPLTAGKYLVATALDIDTENTSEFSNCALVTEATYVVDSTANTADANPGDGACDITGTATDCTLRAAIGEINASSSSGPFRIEFDIPGSGPHTISPPNDLDDLTKPVTIDGTTQPGAACPVNGTTPADLQIVLDGSGMTSGNGLTLASGSGGSEVRGLVIANFPDHGIEVASDDNLITCNHIGLDQVGTADAGNGLNGVHVTGSDNRIGGTAASERNVLSGNDANGVVLWTGATGNKVKGNYIGTNAAGDSAVGNAEAGIRLNGAVDNRIGGAAGGAANLISGNGLYGVQLRAGSDDNKVRGNQIGLNRAGNAAIPNPVGIYIRNSDGNALGGDVPTKGNLIAGNTSYGVHIYDGADSNLVHYNTLGLDKNGDPLGNGSHAVLLADNVSGTEVLTNTLAHNGLHGVAVVSTSAQNTIRFNSIFSNTGRGIDLNNDGVTSNDVGDLDTGANGLQNFPELTATPGSPVIQGVLNSQANQSYTVDLYRSDACDPFGYGEGHEYLGALQVVTDGGGTANFDRDLLGHVSSGDGITATATDAAGNTSEFSNCETLSQVPTPTPPATPTPTWTPTPGPSPTPSNTATPGPSPTPTATPTEGPSPTPTSTSTPGPSPTPTIDPTEGGPWPTPFPGSYDTYLPLILK